MSNVTTTTIVNELWEVFGQIKADPKLDLEKRVKLATSVMDRVLRAGALNLAHQRAVARLPENAASMVPLLNAETVEPGTAKPANSTR